MKIDHPTTNMTTEYSEYRDSIKMICDVIENRVEEQNHISALVSQEVDNSQWIIYYSKNLDVLQLSSNEPEEFKHLIADDSSWREVIQAMAYRVMEQDVYDELRERNML